MKIKRFKNIWTMGLILFGSILVFFYIAKLFFPQFIVGVAELPSIVKIGTYIDTHKWAYHLFNIIIGFLTGYIYCGACCRKRFLNWKNCVILITLISFLRVVSVFMPQQYTAMNYLVLFSLPVIMCYFDKSINEKTFISTFVCFSVDILSQIISIHIRDLLPMATKLNIATITILLIDGWIWRFLLYFFFNNEKRKEKQDGN